MIFLKILLIDDHEIFASGLSDSLIKCDTSNTIENIYTITSQTSVDLISEKILEMGIDILIIDVNIKKIVEMDGFALFKKIKQKIPYIKTIIITGYDFPLFEYEAYEIGASAFIRKETNSTEIYNILMSVFNGNRIFKNTTENLYPLTDREKEILALYSNGYTRNDISKKLYISPRTLANHLAKIYEKLDVSNYQEMLLKAAKLGYIKELL
ncbi:response regulator transcription factor [Peptostreptococcus anaerobius]|uniref:Stage 0 sporulation protein A homolog n=1 Tax=Peptostreptococcus porci TaxID=2652282 RepID=A0A6N7WX57_9FIRM|nr:response regulator transcription factor [Peptostreptococcus porci]